jgi:hypothetical protein
MNRIGSMGAMARNQSTRVAQERPAHEVEIFRTGEVRHEAAVSDDEHGGIDAPFDADKQRTHRAAVADAEVGYAFVVDVGPCAQHIDGALQILDQLDLLGPILRAEPDGRSTAASERGVDRNHDCTETCE